MRRDSSMLTSAVREGTPNPEAIMTIPSFLSFARITCLGRSDLRRPACKHCPDTHTGGPGQGAAGRDPKLNARVSLPVLQHGRLARYPEGHPASPSSSGLPRRFWQPSASQVICSHLLIHSLPCTHTHVQRSHAVPWSANSRHSAGQWQVKRSEGATQPPRGKQRPQRFQARTGCSG